MVERPVESWSAEELKEFGMLMRPSEGFLFLVTYGRSGSTLAQNLLNAIPGYCIRGENANAVYQICRMIDNFDREPNVQMRRDQLAGRGNLVPEIGQPTDPWYGLELVDIDRMGLRFMNIFCREILNIPPRTRVAGFKEIRYLTDLNFVPAQLDIMTRYFPKARFLFLTRNNEEVADSAWWRNHDKEKLVPQLAKADRVFADYAAGKPNCFMMDYTSFLGGPERLVPLFDWLGEKMDRAVVRAVLGRKLYHAKHLGAPRKPADAAKP
ncbi:sulfotransferase [Stagnihabitans tardus]|uniref:Sulfotransferase family protein n=1 Tax=Stagnihabitans tardus TaxID=2699202 RepID=A0AAE4YCZ9_9RHOB|nr:sulfotransferase [Stagnihabitans tardus]NBZ88004.1 hypothetical protein [Stagnihabitans tardus]